MPMTPKEEQYVTDTYEKPAAAAKGEPARTNYKDAKYYEAETSTSNKKKGDEK